MAPHLITHLMKRKRKPIKAHPHRKSQGRKKKKTRVQREPDRLSELPDSLILHILSFLEMKEVVKTGTLSKRWKLLWTEIDTLVYDVHGKREDDMPLEQLREIRKEQMDLYVYFVYNTLIECHSASKVKVFSLCGFAWFVLVLFNNEYMNKIVDEWVECVLGKNVEVLKLNTEGLFYRVTDVLYRSSSITKLKLEQVMIDLSSPVNWPLLKFLSLKKLFITDDMLDNILLGCPVLETLLLKEVFGLTRISIMSRCVKKLKLVGFEYEDDNVDDRLEIKAPFLRELEILGKFIVKNCVIVDVSSLEKANLDFNTYLPAREDDYEDVEDLERINRETAYNYGWIRMVSDLLEATCHVDELLIGSGILQALALHSVFHVPSPPFKCRNVTIDSTLWMYDLPGIQYLFENMPHLETVIVNVSKWKYDLPLSPAKALFPQLASPYIHAPGENLPVKNFKINYLRNPKVDSVAYREIGGECPDTELMVYFLGSCVGLKRLIMCSTVPCCYRTECSNNNCPCRYLSMVSSNMVSAIIPVNAAEWELRKRKFEFEFSFSDHAQGRIQEYFSKWKFIA